MADFRIGQRGLRPRGVRRERPFVDGWEQPKLDHATLIRAVVHVKASAEVNEVNSMPGNVPQGWPATLPLAF